MSEALEFERSPVQAERLEPARHFAASYAGEHAAGTEFVIGAMFVAWGVSTGDILWGLLLGNLLAVLTWALVCAPIAVQTRLTLYAYLEKIGGVNTIKIYSVVNGILFCVLAGTMITVSASAVRILFGIPAQVNWYPTSFSFVLVALTVGAVVVAIAIKGFRRVAQFAQVCAPWMVLMFIAGALSMLPQLFAITAGEAPASGFWQNLKNVLDTQVWVGNENGLGFWHVAAFSWICNFAMHGGLSDMSILRFARKSSYGYFSIFGMFIGHYLAWVCAGIMGAGAAVLLKSTISQLDPGEVAFQALGAAGIIAVIIAGWTTSNPTIYRAGLAFQSLNPKWSRVRVTLVAGVVTTIIACFPFVFTKLLDFVGFMALILAPVGAIILAEHWIFSRLGLTPYWLSYKKGRTNWAALAAWLFSLIFAFAINKAGVHLFFLIPPTWLVALALYTFLASLMGARDKFEEQASAHAKEEQERISAENAYLKKLANSNAEESKQSPSRAKLKLAGAISLISLGVCSVMAIIAFKGGSLEVFRTWLILPTIIYFIAATIWSIEREKL